MSLCRVFKVDQYAMYRYAVRHLGYVVKLTAENISVLSVVRLNVAAPLFRFKNWMDLKLFNFRPKPLPKT